MPSQTWGLRMNPGCYRILLQYLQSGLDIYALISWEACGLNMWPCRVLNTSTLTIFDHSHFVPRGPRLELCLSELPWAGSTDRGPKALDGTNWAKRPRSTIVDCVSNQPLPCDLYSLQDPDSLPRCPQTFLLLASMHANYSLRPLRQELLRPTAHD
jgi:hypothetical protein